MVNIVGEGTLLLSILDTHLGIYFMGIGTQTIKRFTNLIVFKTCQLNNLELSTSPRSGVLENVSIGKGVQLNC